MVKDIELLDTKNNGNEYSLLKKMSYPVDKPARCGWDVEMDSNGNRDYNINVTSREDRKLGKKVLVRIQVRSLFSNYELEPVDCYLARLDPIRKLVYYAVHALFEQGYDEISIQQIYEAMGGKGKPNSMQITKIHQYICEFISSAVKIDNREEALAYNRKTFNEDLTRVIEGRLKTERRANGSIKRFKLLVYETPVFFRYAFETKQITTIPYELLALPMSITAFLAKLNFYLIDQIEFRYKRYYDPNVYNVLRIDNLCGYMDITDRRDKSAFLHGSHGKQSPLITLLEKYVSIKYILGYKIEKNIITLELNPEIIAIKAQKPKTEVKKKIKPKSR